LTEAVRHNPYSLLLLDEIEKANPDILNLFLQVMEDGRLTDALGRTIDFTNIILIATSNAGANFIQDSLEKGLSIEEVGEVLLKEKLRTFFRPEFLNRFDGLIVFKPLKKGEIKQIARLMLKKLEKTLEKKGIAFRASEAAVQELAEMGFDPLFGARPLRRVIQDRVENSIADFLLKGKVGRRDTLILEKGGNLRVEKASRF
jgi:ATP-dependent Clp protease ATP-binding subunit ClpE